MNRQSRVDDAGDAIAVAWRSRGCRARLGLGSRPGWRLGSRPVGLPPLLAVAAALALAGCTWTVPASPSPIHRATGHPTQTPAAQPTPTRRSGTFTRIATLDSRGDGYTTTLLQDGRVLIAGGTGTGYKALATAELYDPRSNSFTPTSSMTTGRTGHSATLLGDGRVLIAGGGSYENSDFLVLAELFDPKTGKFSPTGWLETPRESQTATLLPDGRVIVIGGDQGCVMAKCQIVTSAEVYDPLTGAFSPDGNLGTPRAGHTATLLTDDRLLIVGGEDANSHPIASAEIFDPMTGISTATGSLGAARYGHTATRLSNGQVLVAGGFTVSSAELFDPATGKFSATGSMTAARGFFTASLLRDGRVLMAGGVIGADDPSSAELYEPATGEFALTGSMTTGRANHTATLLADGRVFISGRDYASGGTSDSAEFYQP